MMDKKDIYVFNPGYSIKKDGANRLIIFSTDQNNNDLDDFILFVHPLIAIFLSLFDGKRSTKKAIEFFSEITSIDNAYIWGIFNNFISDYPIHFEFDSKIFHLPKNVLIKGDNDAKRKYQNLDDFLIPFDPESILERRLFTPLTVTFIINLTCVTNCIYCYADRCVSHKYTPLATSKILNIISEAKNIGIQQIDISGGEFFLHTDWKIILKHMVDNGYKPYLSTKVPIDLESLKYIKEIGIESIQISIDTIKKEEMLKILQVEEDYYSSILKTIEYVGCSGLNLITNSQITQVNQNSYRELIEYLIGLSFIKQIRIGAASFSLYKGVKSFHDFRISLSKINEIVQYVEDIKKKTNLEISFSGYSEELRKFDETKRQSIFNERSLCSGNYSSFSLLPDGKCTVCEQLYWNNYFILGDLSKQTIQEMWNSKKAKELNKFSKEKLSNTDTVCVDCDEEEIKFCREDKGICWREQVMAYGDDKFYFPDPRCPKAPKGNEIWFE